jgi:hypothetical protein
VRTAGGGHRGRWPSPPLCCPRGRDILLRLGGDGATDEAKDQAHGRRSMEWKVREALAHGENRLATIRTARTRREDQAASKPPRDPDDAPPARSPARLPNRPRARPPLNWTRVPRQAQWRQGVHPGAQCDPVVVSSPRLLGPLTRLTKPPALRQQLEANGVGTVRRPPRATRAEDFSGLRNDSHL